MNDTQPGLLETKIWKEKQQADNPFPTKTKIISLKISPNTLLSSFLFAEIRIVRIFASSNVNDIITIEIAFELFVR